MRRDLATLALACALAAPGCERERRRMPPDQQIALLDACEQARRDGVAAPADKREAAVLTWVHAIDQAKGLCTNHLHDALVTMDDASHLLALDVIKRLDWRAHASSLLADLDAPRLPPAQRDRALATLKALTGQDFGTDRAAWDAWLRSAR